MSILTAPQLWQRIEARDWPGVAALLHENVVIDWPHSGERIRGRHNYVALNRDYPGDWHLTVLGAWSGPDREVVEVRVDHAAEVCFAAGFYEVREGVVVRGTEYWTTARSQAPVVGRAHLTESMDA